MEKYFYGLGEFFKLIEEKKEDYIFETLGMDYPKKVGKDLYGKFYFEISKEQMLMQYDIPLNSKDFVEIYRKRAKENNIKFSLSSMKINFSFYNIKLSIFKIDNNKALVLFEDYGREIKIDKTNVSIVENIDEFIIFDEENKNKEYKLTVETYNYNEISEFYDKLSGYKFKTNLFISDEKYQKVIVDILNLDIDDCKKLVNMLRNELHLLVYKNNIKILEQSDE